jgi:SAM-dependent methyltransferase
VSQPESFRPESFRPEPVRPEPVRPGYDELGVDGFYTARAADYRNPHEAAIIAALADVDVEGLRVLDLACGSGEVTLALRGRGALCIDGIDPYTGPAYLSRTGQVAEPVRFEDIAHGALSGRTYDLVVCSFALHLIEASWLPSVCRALAEGAESLVVITPHKRPELRAGWGWLVPPDERRHDRVRLRTYRRG